MSQLPQHLPYKHSILSLISIAVVTGTGLFLMQQSGSLRMFETVIEIYREIIASAVVGGIVIVMIRSTKKRHLKYSFLYNLTGTVNLLFAAVGLIQGAEKTSYAVTSAFVIGMYIYHDIFIRRSIR